MEKSKIFYTNVARHKNNILLRYVAPNGQRKQQKIKYKPYLYLTDAEGEDATGLRGEKLRKYDFDSIWEAKGFFEQYHEIEGVSVHGTENWVTQFMAKTFPEECEYNKEYIKGCCIDIETFSGSLDSEGNIVDGPFPYPEVILPSDIDPTSYRASFIKPTLKTEYEVEAYKKHVLDNYKTFEGMIPDPDFEHLGADFPITLLGLYSTDDDTFYQWAMPLRKDRGKYVYDPMHKDVGGLNVKYMEFDNEWDMLTSFANFWAERGYDYWTGWNTINFDNPYITNRIKKVLGNFGANQLSPWGEIQKRSVRSSWGDFSTYNWVGCANLDYMEVYKAFSYGENESYSLDFISYKELGERKLDHTEEGNLNNLYTVDYEKFVNYNLKDVNLPMKLDAKLKFIDLVFMKSYMANCNYVDSLATISPWDHKLYTQLHNMGLEPEIKHMFQGNVNFEGAFVVTPDVGAHKWITSIDLNSLYPHIIQQYNLGPETIVTEDEKDVIITELCSEIETMVRNEQDITRIMKLNRLKDAIHIRSHNMVTELIEVGPVEFKTLKSYNVSMTPNVQFFHLDKMSIFSKNMRDIYAQRAAVKKLMLAEEQNLVDEKEGTHVESKIKELDALVSQLNGKQLVLKVGFMNSFYGAVSNKAFKSYFDVRIAEAITVSGRLINQWTSAFLEQYLKGVGNSGKRHVTYGDTDSLYTDLEDIVVEVLKIGDEPVDDIVRKLNGWIESDMMPEVDKMAENLASTVNAYEQRMIWAREVIAPIAIFIAKKKYVMLVKDSEGVHYEKPKLKYMGVESKKSSTPEHCRTWLNECYRLVLENIDNPKIIYSRINEIKEEFMSKDIEEIASASSVNNIEKYSTGDPNSPFGFRCPNHVKGAITHNLLLKQLNITDVLPISSGSKIKLLGLVKQNPTPGTVVAFSEFLPPIMKKYLEKYFDRNERFEKTFINPLQLFLDAINWSTEPKADISGFFV